MKREIKFKAKRVDNGEWVIGLLNKYQSTILINSEIFTQPTLGDPCGEFLYQEFEVYPETVCQFTGLKDKDGVEIYENDILKIYYLEIKAFSYHNVIFQMGCYSMEDGLLLGELVNFNSTYIKVTGNIHDKSTSDHV